MSEWVTFYLTIVLLVLGAWILAEIIHWVLIRINRRN